MISTSYAENDDIHFHGDLNTWGGESERENQFFRGDTILFSGWSNAYQDWGGVIQTPHSTFEVQIRDPDRVSIFNNKIEADDRGNISFEFELKKDAKFGKYEIRTAIYNEGFKTYSVDYRDFFVIPHEDEFVTAENYSLKLWFEKNTIKYGIYNNVFWEMCPHHIQSDLKEFADPVSHQEVREGELAFYIEYINPNGERKIENVSYGNDTCQEHGNWNVLADSAGKWTAQATARWFDGKNFYEIKSEPKEFVVKEPLFASKQITTIFSNSNYNDIKLLDWNPDGKTILLSYNQILEDGNYYSRLATFDVKSKTITDLGIPEKFYKDPSNWLYGQFSSSGKQVYFFVIDNREVYLFDILQKTTVDTGIQSDWFRADSQGNIFYIKTGQTTSSTEGNPEYHLFKLDTKTNMTQEIAKDPSFWSFDVNTDGTKILYRKEIESGYGWAQRDLAVYDVDAKTSTTIPNIEGEDCGQQPIFAPNDELMIYHVQSCGKGWSGGALGITNNDGNFEILTPPSSENPDSFVISPDGISLVYRHALYVNGTYVVGLSQMMLAKSVPEFGTISVLILVISLVSVVIIGTKFRNNL